MRVEDIRLGPARAGLAGAVGAASAGQVAEAIDTARRP